jgi:hypothetical protein
MFDTTNLSSTIVKHVLQKTRFCISIYKKKGRNCKNVFLKMITIASKDFIAGNTWYLHIFLVSIYTGA